MGKGWPPPLPLVHTFLPPEKSFGASFLPSFAHDPGKQGTVGMQVRAALRQQMPAMPHQPFSFHGRPPAAKEPLCGGDTQAPPRNRENGTLPTAVCSPTFASPGTPGTVTGCRGTGAENTQVPAVVTVCLSSDTQLTPAAQHLQLNPCSFPTGHPGNTWQGSPMGKGLTPRLVLCLGGTNQPKRQRFSFREKLTFH